MAAVFKGLKSIRLVIIAAMMLAAALTGLTQAWLGNSNVRESIYSSIEDRLTSVTHGTAQSLEVFFGVQRALVRLLGSDPRVVESLRDLDAALDQMPWPIDTLSIANSLLEFYESSFIPSLNQISDGADLDPRAFLPAKQKSRYLQDLYVASNQFSRVERERLLDARDGSLYSQVHARIHSDFKTIRRAFNLEDIFLINPDGDVIYSVIKETDFFTNLRDGAFNDSGLARAFGEASRFRAMRPVHLEDYSFYLPSRGEPSFFVSTPVHDGARFVGVIAVQISSDSVNNIISQGGNWENAGLGDTGDIFLVGRDGLLRSTQREFEANPDDYLAKLGDAGVGASTTDRVQAFQTPVSLIAPFPDGSELNSTMQNRVNRVGERTLVVANPIDVPGLSWLAVSALPVSEANQPNQDFQRLMMLALATTVALTTIGAMFLTGFVTRPLSRLADDLDDAVASDDRVMVVQSREDEIGDVSRSAQTVLDRFHDRLDAEERNKLKSDGLLGRFLPEGIVRLIQLRSQSGGTEFNVSEMVDNVSFVVCRISNYDEVAKNTAPDKMIGQLDQLVRVVDAIAAKHGAEKIRTARDSYFAAVGLSTSLVDHRRRALEFALETRAAIRASGLEMSGGLSTGSAITGVIGRDRLAFDVFGVPVDEAWTLSRKASAGGILVTEALATSVGGSYEFAEPDDTGVRELVEADSSEAAAE